MSYDLDDADLTLIDSAPISTAHQETVRAPIDAVWQAVSDPAAWEQWFPKVKKCGWTSEETRCVGSTRTIQIGPASFDERFVEWDEEAMRYHFMVTRTSLPIAKRMVEGAELTDNEDGTVTVTWRSAVEPRVAFIPKGMIRQSFEKGLARGFAGLQGYLDAQT
jgi:carbon monoxide dehydrogenase subunit G